MAQNYAQHIPGNLNFVANRKGWSRNITLSPAEVANITYATLEHILELRTINLRGRRLRVYVEHPAGSGIWAPVRPWTDDGTLQAELVKTFFVERMKDGTVTVLDVRDVAEPDINPHAPMHPRGWLRRGNTLTKHTSTRSDLHLDSDMDPMSIPDSRGGIFGRFKGSKDAMPETPPSPPPSEPEMETREEEMMEEHGWRPVNVIRRFTTRKRKETVSTAKSKNVGKADIGAPIPQASKHAVRESPIIDPQDFEPMYMRETAESAAEKSAGFRKLLSRKSTKDVKATNSFEAPIRAVRTASDVLPPGLVDPRARTVPDSMPAGMYDDFDAAAAREGGMTFSPSPASMAAAFGAALPSGNSAAMPAPRSGSSPSRKEVPAFGVPMPPNPALPRVSEASSRHSFGDIPPPPALPNDSAPHHESVASMRVSRSSLSRAPSPRGARAPSPPKHPLPGIPTPTNSSPVECGNYDQLDYAEHRVQMPSSDSRMVEMIQS